ncbi:alpha/beta hydrolase [Gordonia sp. CPCC 206044]|uniref:alpha/beta hydrolase n=1 Tax=Gordonia sp. CPCC 206044 TaxID=3140793 RepID=UPI003AF3CFE0
MIVFPPRPEPPAPIADVADEVEILVRLLTRAAQLLENPPVVATDAPWAGHGAQGHMGVGRAFDRESDSVRGCLTRGAVSLARYGDALSALQSLHRDLSSRQIALNRAIDDLAARAGAAHADDTNARVAMLTAHVAAYTTDNSALQESTRAAEDGLVDELSMAGVIDKGIVRGNGIGGEAGRRLSGELPDLPAHARDVVNRRRLESDIAHARRALAESDDPGRRRDAERVLRNARSVLDALAQAEHAAAGADVLLYGYDADANGGDGRSLIGIGDLDSARHVAWHVPGMSTDITKAGPGVTTAATLFAAAGGAHADVAVISWIGYDAPSDSDTGAVLTSGAARDGGDLLAADIRRFVADRAGMGRGQGTGAADHLDVHLVGHSYGATTVGWAGDDGRLAGLVDTVTLIGSPGAGGVTRAAEFGIGAEHVYVGSASDDVVARLGGAGSQRWTGLGGLGVDPATTYFGAERFRAEGGPTTRFGGSHSGYVTTDTESLGNLARIISGHGDQITHENRKSTWDVLAGTDPARRRDR